MTDGIYIGLTRYDPKLTPNEPKDWVCPECGHECGDNEARECDGCCWKCGHVLVEDEG